MKIIIVCYLKLDELPPAISLLKVLSKKYDIVYIGKDDMTDRYREMIGERIEFKRVISDLPQNDGSLGTKIKQFIYWKLYNTRLKAGRKVLKNTYEKGDIVWVLHEYTLLHLGSIIKKYPFYLTMYELHNDLFKQNSELKNYIRMAKKTVVPEYTRAAIVEACVGLSKMPYVLPNKPYEFDDKDIELVDNPMEKVVLEAHKNNKLVIMYSGIFLRERKLDTILEAVKQLEDKFEIVLIGRESEYLNELLELYPNAKYLGFFVPPKHLSMVKLADIGILTYVSDSGSINPVFCAPNKVWEYGKYGIPMLCNDIPGLKYTVEYNGFGYCCNINNIKDIKEKLEIMYESYDDMSIKAKEYYCSVDIEMVINQIIKEDE